MQSQHIQKMPNAGVYNQLPDVSKALFEAKAKSGLTFEQIAKAMGRSEIWTASIFYGQAKPEGKDIDSLCKTLNIDAAESHSVIGEGFWPQRGLGPMPPTDPLLYRLYEVLLVFGQPIKAIIHEKFGDGIMSAIDFNMDVKRVPHEKGDRVVITLDGKFLSYSKF